MLSYMRQFAADTKPGVLAPGSCKKRRCVLSTPSLLKRLKQLLGVIGAAVGLVAKVIDLYHKLG
jgi:hypothetical protein